MSGHITTVQFEVTCHTVIGQRVAVCGSCDVLGSWDPAHALLLDSANYPVWTGQAKIEQETFEFKYALVEVESASPPRLLRWEGDIPNRKADLTADGTSRMILSHVFGDPAKISIQVVVEETPSPPPSETSGSLLEALQVDSCTRATRLVRSISGLSFSQKYELKPARVLGSGMSGSVCVAKSFATGAEVAVKTLNTNGLPADKLEQVRAEVQNQLTMDHPNICRLLEVYEEPGCIRLVLERMKGSDLFEHLTKRGRYLESDAVGLMRQICGAIAYCHRQGVCHRDVKLENFCLEDQSQDARVKMIDFGLSEAFGPMPMTDACGTLYYVAPEVLKSRYDEKCDMWSLGVLAYILLSGQPPFQGKDDRETVKLIKSGQVLFPPMRWRHVSTNGRNFIESLLKVNPQERMSAEQALAHPWLTKQVSQEEDVELEEEVLKGMKTFSHCNALKRAVLYVIAPCATAEEVSRWADQFEALDEHCSGTVSVKDLLGRLLKSTSAEEAEAIAAALASLEDGEQISYSAFLAACLGAHTSLEDKQLHELFQRLDRDRDGKVTAAEVCMALGDVVDLKALRTELGGRSLTYAEFKWLLLRPHVGQTIFGLRQLLGAFKEVGLPHCWRVYTGLGRHQGIDEDKAMEAARQENAVWRMWHFSHNHSLEGCQEEEEEEDEDLATTAPIETSGFPLTEPSAQVVKLDEELPEVAKGDATDVWRQAMHEAKSGDIEAIRRENLAWRTLHQPDVRMTEVAVGHL